MAHPFTYCELHSNDTGKARDFFRGLFDWKLSESPMPDHPYTMIDPGEGFPGGLLPARPAGLTGWLVYVRVGDLDSATRKAAALGAKVVLGRQEIPEGAFSVIVDPAGAPLGLFEPKK